MLKRFQAADRRFAQRVDSFAAISHEVRDRIRFVYGRDSRVVYPPCDTDFFAAAEQPAERSGVVVAGRLVPYKRVDLAIEACARAGVDLTVVGEGPERDRLEALAKRLAPGRVHFLGGVSRNDLRSTMASAAALVFPGREDFGIVPVEAQAAGTPVIAFGAAGALDTVVDHPGSLVPTQTPEAFAKALETVLADPPSGEACRHRAAEFSRQNFDAQFRAWVTDTLSPGAV